jgi:hypothetical protein
VHITEAAGCSGQPGPADRKEFTIIEEKARDGVEALVADYRRIILRGGSPREVLSELAFSAFAGQRAILLGQDGHPDAETLPSFRYMAQAELETERLWTDVIRRGIAAGEFRPDLDPGLVYRVVRDAAWMAARWYRPGGRLSAEQVVSQYLTIALDGIGLPRCCPGYSGAP